MSQPTIEKYLKTAGSSSSQSSSKRSREETTPPDKQKNSKKFLANSRNTAKASKVTTPTSNSFDGLPVDEPEQDRFVQASKKKVVNNTPPIVVELMGEWTHQKIRDVIGKYVKEYHIQHRGRHIIRVQVYSSKNHHELREGLVKEHIPFHTFTRKDETTPKAVIKGLPKCVQSTISKELDELGFTGASVTEIKTSYTTECPPVLVQLPNGTNMSKFKQIKYLANCVVTIDRFKPSKRIGTQCFRCQGFGHASRNCNRPPRCVKCAEPHPTWECTKKTRDEPAKCCNCQEHHPANFGQCSERLKYISRIESKRSTQSVTKLGKMHSNQLRTSSDAPKTWAQVANSTSRKNLPQQSDSSDPLPTPPAADRPLPSTAQAHSLLTSRKQAQRPTYAGATVGKPQQDLETMEMLEILSTIQSIKQEFVKCSTFMDKVILILTHLGHYV